MTRPAGAADTVDVGLRHLGEVVVEHVGELLNVQSPGGDVGSHQTADGPGLEVGQRLLPGGLALVSVDSSGGNTRFDQIPGHLVGPVLGAGKDQRIFTPNWSISRESSLVLLPRSTKYTDWQMASTGEDTGSTATRAGW